MKRYSIAFIFVLLAVFLVACDPEEAFETVTTVDLSEHSSKIVIQGIYHADTNFVIGLERSQNILDPHDAYSGRLEDAIISLYANDELVEHLKIDINAASSGGYPTYHALSTYPQPNIDYHLQVQSTAYEMAEASSRLPTLVPIQRAYVSDTIAFFTSANQETISLELEISIEFQDDVTIDNYYFITVALQHTQNRYAQDDNGYTIYDDMGNPTIVDQDLVTYTTPFSSSDPSLEGSNDFIDELDPSSLEESFFSNAGARFSDALFNGKHKTLKIICRYSDDGNGEQDQITLTLGSLSKEVYLYKSSVLLQQQTRDNPFAEPVRIHSNVMGGFGIFGGFTFSQATLK